MKDISNDCGVNRQTFYYHFKDVYDLIEWIYNNEVIQEIEEMHLDTYETWQECLYYVLQYILNNKEFIKNTYHSISRKYVYKFLYDNVEKLIISMLDEKFNDTKIKQEDKKFIVDFYKHALIGLIQEWIEDGLKMKPKELIKKLNCIVEGNVETIIERFETVLQ